MRSPLASLMAGQRRMPAAIWARVKSVRPCWRGCPGETKLSLPRRMRNFIEKRFHLSAAGTTVRTEVLAGLTTFMTMSYIIFVQPAVLSATGMDFGAVLAATCIVTAIGCFLMAFLANYPIAVAPATGHNLFFAFTVVGTMHYSWQVALGAVFLSGIAFLVMSLWGVREALLHAIPDSLKRGIAVGIGLLI